MQNASRIVTGIGVLVGIVALGILVGWWGSRQAATSRTAVENAARPAPVASTPAPTRLAEPSVPPPSTGTQASLTAATSTSSAGTNTNLAAAWENKLDDILASDQDDTNKVAQLFAMFPQLPEDGQEEVAQHLSNLVTDEDYSRLGQMLLNSKLSESVLDVLMSDVLNRPNSVKLPLLLQVAQTPNHPKADEAKDLMELYLDEDNPAQWPDKMKQWLKENPD